MLKQQPRRYKNALIHYLGATKGIGRSATLCPGQSYAGPTPTGEDPSKAAWGVVKAKIEAFDAALKKQSDLLTAALARARKETGILFLPKSTNVKLYRARLLGDDVAKACVASFRDTTFNYQVVETEGEYGSTKKSGGAGSYQAANAMRGYSTERNAAYYNVPPDKMPNTDEAPDPTNTKELNDDDFLKTRRACKDARTLMETSIGILKPLESQYDAAVDDAVCKSVAFWGAQDLKKRTNLFDTYPEIPELGTPTFASAKHILLLGLADSPPFPVKGYVETKDRADLNRLQKSKPQEYSQLYEGKAPPPTPEQIANEAAAVAAAAAAEEAAAAADAEVVAADAAAAKAEAEEGASKAKEETLAKWSEEANVEVAAAEETQRVSPLPGGWEVVSTSDGDVFYRNTGSNQVEWTLPEGIIAATHYKHLKPGKTLQPGWQAVGDNEGDLWYEKSGEGSIWEPPYADSASAGRRRRTRGGAKPPIPEGGRRRRIGGDVPKPSGPRPTGGRRRKTRRTLRPFRRSTRGRRR